MICVQEFSAVCSRTYRMRPSPPPPHLPIPSAEAATRSGALIKKGDECPLCTKRNRYRFQHQCHYVTTGGRR